ncbi:uncharacterized protein LOC126824525 [Patella vulgata]|uniref:uncharacterized protein LOC126824525 n=1 Tax=Patella vulgata TaxID=6465 RepID=UPI00217FD03D|nr:uncharacterized protein LOC126824525 [Patella vulgata]
MSRMQRDSVTKMERELSCPICFEFYENPLQLSCLHSFCRDCIKDIIGTNPPLNVFECPQCRRRIELDDKGLDGLQKNFQLASIVDAYKTHLQHNSPEAPTENPVYTIDQLIDFLIEDCEESDLPSIVQTVETIVASDFPNIPIAWVLRELLKKLVQSNDEIRSVTPPEVFPRSRRLSRTKAVDIASDSSTDSSVDNTDSTQHGSLEESHPQNVASPQSNIAPEATNIGNTQSTNNAERTAESQEAGPCGFRDLPDTAGSETTELSPFRRSVKNVFSGVNFTPVTCRLYHIIRQLEELQINKDVTNDQENTVPKEILEVQSSHNIEPSQTPKINSKLPTGFIDDLVQAQQNRVKLQEPSANSSASPLKLSDGELRQEVNETQQRSRILTSEFIAKMRKQRQQRQNHQENSSDSKLPKPINQNGDDTANVHLCDKEPTDDKIDDEKNPRRGISVKERLSLFEPGKTVDSSLTAIKDKQVPRGPPTSVRPKYSSVDIKKPLKEKPQLPPKPKPV